MQRVIINRNKGLGYLGLLLIALLLSSPCSVRNTVQKELGIEVTETFNKSKSCLIQKEEFVLEVNTSEFTKKFNSVKIKNSSKGFLTSFTSFFPFKENALFSFVQQDGKQEPPIPLYILYKRFKYMCIG